MKIDRRSFLSFLIGGAAGTALSPLPWKLTDDLSIWTQNWPWTPVPPNGEASYANSTCTLCPGGCGITVRKIDDRVVKIEGMKGHPVNDGGICELGTAGAQLLYSPSRVKSPLKKVDGKWRPISWNAALAEISKKLGQLRSSGLSASVACISDSDRGTVAELWNRFLQVYGSPNFIRTPSIQDNYEQALYLTQGVRARPGFDLKNSDFILSFGSGLIEGWQSPVYMFRAKSALVEKNGTMKQVEPRLSKTAAKSSQWVPIKPGTEGALALGLCHVIVRERLYHQDFVENYSAGLAERNKMVFDAYPPQLVSKITGIAPAAITALAREFARARKPIAICGRGKGNAPGGLQEFLAVHMLNALVGNIDKTGGIQAVPEPDYINWPEPQIDPVAARSLQHARLDGAGGKEYPHARYLLNRLPEVIKSNPQSPVQVLFICEANPAYSMPDSRAMIEALEKIPLVVSFSSFMDETAACADLILPNHIYLERLEDVPVAAGFPRPIISVTRPVIEPLYNTRHVGDVIIQLARAMGGAVSAAFEWENYEDCFEQTFGDRMAVLAEQGFLEDTDFSGRRWADAFETDSSKFEFAGTQIDALPAYNPVTAPGDESFYPLVLVPFDSMRLASGYIGSPPFMVKALEASILKGNEVLVEVNPATAAKYGLKDGSQAILSTPRGKATVKVYLFDGIMPGVVAIARGLGHTAYDKFLAYKGANYNALSAVVEDPATGLDAAWGIRAKLGKA